MGSRSLFFRTSPEIDSRHANVIKKGQKYGDIPREDLIKNIKRQEKETGNQIIELGNAMFQLTDMLMGRLVIRIIFLAN